MKQFAPATSRNREPILGVLKRWLPNAGKVVEIASGTGEHVAFFADHFPDLVWQPTDANPSALQSIAAWSENKSTVLPPLQLDASSGHWPIDSKVDALININMIHISPWCACEGLFAGASQTLKPGGILYLYGPYNIDGAFTAPSNEQFDQSLRQRNGTWGLRDLSDVCQLAQQHGLTLAERTKMPANNQSLVFRQKMMQP